MAALKLLCPACDKVLNVSKQPPFTGNCPKCRARFSVSADGRSRVLAAGANGALPAASSTTALRTAIPAGASEPGGLPWAKIALFGGLGGVALALGLVILVLANREKLPTTPTPGDPPSGLTLAPPTSSGPAESSEPRGAAKGADIAPAPAGDFKPGPGFAERPAKTITLSALAGGHPGVDQPAVDAAIDKGVAYLRTARPGNAGEIGLTGLTLLYCGVPKEDPLVRKLAEQARRVMTSSHRTYEIGACVWFLDRLGAAEDQALIRTLAYRLIAGQRYRGGWYYNVPLLTQEQEEELARLLREQFENPAGLPMAPGSTPDLPVGKVAITPPVFSPLSIGPIRDCPVFLFKEGTRLSDVKMAGHEDNSLTQFSLLALWRAKNYGVPIHRSLAFAEQRFRDSQLDQGSWTYTWFKSPGPGVFVKGGRQDSMTCSGLLGLAVGRGGRVDLKKDVGGKGDDAIEKGLIALGRRLKELGKSEKSPSPIGVDADAWGDLYFLWSLERMAVLYDLRFVGETDWYAWGVPYILRGQKEDGSWLAGHSTTADTCFALLFLRRANVAQDLTVVLQGLSVTKNAGERQGGFQAPFQGAAK